MNKEDRRKLHQEFGIHFKNSKGELQFLEAFIEELLIDEYKKGYNQCLKDQKLTGERWQHLYL
jgi:hypothetical protein